MTSSASGLQPRLSSAGGLSFREVGDWFKNLGDDLGNMMGIPRAHSTRARGGARRSPSTSAHGPGAGRALSDLGGVQPRLPSTSILAKQQQVRGRSQWMLRMLETCLRASCLYCTQAQHAAALSANAAYCLLRRCLLRYMGAAIC